MQALSHSGYWKDTVIFVVEDDSQAGPDHVDSHRSPFFAISAYNRPGTIHRFVNTTDVIAAIEDILKIGRLSKFDYFSRPLTDVFAASPDLTPYDPLIPQQDLNEKTLRIRLPRACPRGWILADRIELMINCITEFCGS